MVTVKVTSNDIKVTGHTDTGKDKTKEHELVCEDITILMQALEVGINKNFLEVVKKEHGEIHYKLYEPSNKAVQLTVLACLKMVIDTIKVLAEQYPDYVEVVTSE